MLSTTLYLIPAKLSLNRTTLRGVKSLITAFSKCFFDFTQKTEIFEAGACLFQQGKKFQVGHLLSTTLYLIPTQLGLNRKTFRRVRSSITTFLTHSTQFSANVIDGKNQKILGKIKKFFVIKLQCILYIAAPLNLLLGEIFSDLFYSLRYNNKEFFNFAQNFLLFASGYLKLQ